MGRKIEFDVEAWTLELGAGMVMNSTSVAKGLAGIKNYLAYKQMLSLSAIDSVEVTFRIKK